MVHHPEIPPNGEWFFRRILNDPVAYPGMDYYFNQGLQMPTIVLIGACPREKYLIASVAMRLWDECGYDPEIAKLYVPNMYHETLLLSWEQARKYHISCWKNWGQFIQEKVVKSDK